jgi:hypothetical protein
VAETSIAADGIYRGLCLFVGTGPCCFHVRDGLQEFNPEPLVRNTQNSHGESGVSGCWKRSAFFSPEV